MVKLPKVRVVRVGTFYVPTSTVAAVVRDLRAAVAGSTSRKVRV